MKTTSCASCVVLIVVAVVVLKVSSAKFIYGKEAEKLCQAYKKTCPRSKVCAIQIVDVSIKIIKFPVCVHQFELKVQSPVCKEAPSPGRCGANFRRWYFNVHMAGCAWFTYSGCGGNDNNFRSREECERICHFRGDDSNDVSTTSTPEPTTIRRPPRPHQHRHHYSQPQKQSAYSYTRDYAYRLGQPHTTTTTTSTNTTTTNINSRYYEPENAAYSNKIDGNNRYNAKNYKHEHVQGDDNDTVSENEPSQSRYLTHRVSSLVDQRNVMNNSDESPFDLYRAPYVNNNSVSLHGNWSDAADRHTSDSSSSSSSDSRRELRTFQPPLELQRPEDSPLQIRRKPRPSYHHHHGPSNVHAALHITQPKEEDTLLGFPKAVEMLDNNAPSFPDNSRQREENDKLKRIAENSRALMARHERRRFPPARMPRREVSLMSRPSVIAIVPELASEGRADVKAGMTSSARSSYAPGAGESLRRYPPSRRLGRKLNRNPNRTRGSRRRRRRRRHRHRGRGRRNHRARGRRNYAANSYVWNPPIRFDKAQVSGTRNFSSKPTNTPSSLENPSRFAEFRLQNASYVVPRYAQSDEETGAVAASQPAKKKKRNRGRRRRRKEKRKGRGHGGINRGREEEEADSFRGNVSSVTQANRYYERIHLFGLLDRPKNDTDVA